MGTVHAHIKNTICGNSSCFASDLRCAASTEPTTTMLTIPVVTSPTTEATTTSAASASSVIATTPAIPSSAQYTRAEFVAAVRSIAGLGVEGWADDELLGFGKSVCHNLKPVSNLPGVLDSVTARTGGPISDAYRFAVESTIGFCPNRFIPVWYFSYAYL